MRSDAKAETLWEAKARWGGPVKDASLPMSDKPSPFEGGGGGLISTVDDYLKFARLMIGRGEADGVRLVRPETIDMMTANRLTDAQAGKFRSSGLPFWRTQGFGLGVSTIMDAQLHQVDRRRLEGLLRMARRLRHLVAGGPGRGHDRDLSDPGFHGARTRGGYGHAGAAPRRPGWSCPMFQKMVYAALGK